MLEKTWMILFLILGSLSSTSAQSSVDLCLVKANDYWQCVLKAEQSFTGILSNLQFTLAYDKNEVQIDSIIQKGKVSQFLPLVYAGNSIQHGTLTYQKVVGVGLVTLDSLGETVVGNQWIAVANIFLSDTSAELSIQEDIWTTENNGQFYVELNGEDRTGKVENGCPVSFFTSIEETRPTSPWHIFPNPFESKTQILSSEASQVSLRVNDLMGKQIWDQEANLVPHSPLELDFSFLPAGIWIFTIRSEDRVHTFRLLKS